MSNVDVVRTAFESYLTQNREAAAEVMADDLVFTSPQDDHIDRAAYFERCFPTVDRLRSQEILEAAPAGDDGVFVLYEYELKSGGRYRNTEFITVRDGRITEIQVFFGGRFPKP